MRSTTINLLFLTTLLKIGSSFPQSIPTISSTISSTTTTSVNFTDFSKWEPAEVNEQRSPCPMMNCMANRSGANISLALLIPALQEVLNVGIDFTVILGLLGLGQSPNIGSSTFSFGNLRRHGNEHDASLSRLDFALGNSTTFHQENFNMVLAQVIGQTRFNTTSGELARQVRVADSIANNPAVVYGFSEKVFGIFEVCLFLTTLSGPITKDPLVNHVKIFFEEERLPWNEGWRKSSSPINSATLSECVGQLQSIQGITNGEILINSADTLNAILTGSQAANRACYLPGATPCTY